MTVVKIRFVEGTKDLSQKMVIMGFEGKSSQYFLDSESMMLYVGTTYEFDPITESLYEKVDYYELGLLAKIYLPKKIETLTIDNSGLDDRESVNFAIGILQSYYKWSYKNNPDKNDKNTVPQLTFEKQLDFKAATFLEAVNSGVTFTKNISNMRADELTPSSYPDLLVREFSDRHDWIKIRVLSQSDIDNLGMGMLAGVGRASKHGYSLVAIEILPKETPQRTVALVGKGLTFDSGGINIKPGDYSFGMHMDMGGSAIIYGVAKSLSLLPQPSNTRFIFVSAMVENGVNDSAMHPGDVLTNLVGQTALIKHTDAEGRLTLADSVPWTVLNYHPDEIITLATLTGHAVVAYTDKVAPIFSNDSDLQRRIYTSFLDQGEQAITVSQPRNVQKAIVDESGLADYTNTHNYKSPQGGAQSAAAFVISSGQPKLWKKQNQELPEKVPMAHIDVAGPTADRNELNTGYGVRALVDYCLKSDAV